MVVAPATLYFSRIKVEKDRFWAMELVIWSDIMSSNVICKNICNDGNEKRKCAKKLEISIIVVINSFRSAFPYPEMDLCEFT